MLKKKQAVQAELFEKTCENEITIETEKVLTGASRAISLELGHEKMVEEKSNNLDFSRPEIPSRWEAAKDVAERKHVMQVLLKQIRRVETLDYLKYLVELSKDEGYVWVVYGESGSGKSTFFHSLEYQTDKQIRTLIINGDKINLASQKDFTEYLINEINKHKKLHGVLTPLIVVLEERENQMSTEERSAISQSLRNVLRPPGPGKNVIFVLPVTNSSQGTLFIKQVESTGVSIPAGHNTIYTFHGPSYSEHVDIFIDLFVTLNDSDISDYGIQRSDLQAHVSSQQTIGQYIRTIREKLIKSNQTALTIITSHNYKPFTVIMCFINPLPGYRTEPITKGMTINPFGKIRTGEVLRVTESQRAQRWQNKRQALANIISTLDIRIVEIPPQIIAKLLYVYDWRNPPSGYKRIKTLVEEKLKDEGIDNYNAAKVIRQNLRSQLKASNLFRIIANEETKSYHTPKISDQTDSSETKHKRKEMDNAELSVTRIICENSHGRQSEIHDIFAQALDDLLKNSGNIASVSNFKSIASEVFLTLGEDEKKVIRPDIIIEMQDKLFLLELCWRRDEHFTYADIASYVLRKIEESYINLPLVQALKGE